MKSFRRPFVLPVALLYFGLIFGPGSCWVPSA